MGSTLSADVAFSFQFKLVRWLEIGLLGLELRPIRWRDSYNSKLVLGLVIGIAWVLHGSMQPRHNSSRGQDLNSTRASMRAYNLNNGGNSNFVARACFTAITGNEVLNLE